jgi:hypothetical protein
VGVGPKFDASVMSTIRSWVTWYTLDTIPLFKEIMDKDFQYIVTQLYSHFTMKMIGGDFEVERVFGSPGYEYPGPGILFETGASAPSAQDEEGTKGGVVVVKLKKVRSSGEEILFPIEYVHQTGKIVHDQKKLSFPNYTGEDIWTGPARKAILLTRLVSILKHFVRDHRYAAKTGLPVQPSISIQTGITPPTELTDREKEIDTYLAFRNTSSEYFSILKAFLNHYQNEVTVIQDEKLLDEVKILEEHTGLQASNFQPQMYRCGLQPQMYRGLQPQMYRCGLQPNQSLLQVLRK